MKKIVLTGDSIRMGYQETVKELIGDKAEIWAPEGNGMHSVHHLFNIQPWYIDTQPDIIHMNFGLWDCRRLAPSRKENAVPVEIFARNLDFILEKLKQSTSATIIWATLTPVVQERYNARFTRPQDPCRDATDNALYNAAAAPVLARYGIEVNDLYQLVVEEGPEKMINEDGVHYTPEGCRRLGEVVTSRLLPHLS